MTGVRIKYCGLTRPGDVAAAAAAGAAYVGFVFFPKSPRNVTLETARALALATPPGIAKVALTVDADDHLLAEITDSVPLDMIQLHGGEPPRRVAGVRAMTGLPVMKAIGVAEPGDLAAVDAHGPAADQLLIDAKAPDGAEVPGGNGMPFDWSLLRDRRWPVPWMLAGGLTPDNAAEAVRLTGAGQVDLSSGVERERGVKDPELMRAFSEALGVPTRGSAADSEG